MVEAVRILRVSCPICKKVVRLTIDNKVLELARNSPIGLTGVADVHKDHVMVVYVDSNGNERGVRAYRALLRDAETGRRITIPPKYLEPFQNINGFRVILGRRGVIVECFKKAEDVFVKTEYKDLALEITPRVFDNFEYALKWMKSFLYGLYSAINVIRFETLMRGLQVLDASLFSKPLLIATKVYEIIFSSKSLNILVDKRSLELFEKYMDRMPWFFTGSRGYILRSHGKVLYEVLWSTDPLSIREKAECVVELVKRGVIELTEAEGV